jgi:Ni/Fe-hydrogenase subunit HybB-like protein
VLFEVGLCVFLYLNVLLIEYSPAALEWLGLRKIRSIIVRLTLVLTIFGVVLSTMHQSSLGALFLIAPSKVHPLWYSTYLPVFFFVSSIFAGLSMVIFEGSLSHHYFHDKMDKTHLEESEGVVLGFGKAAAWVMSGYLAMKVFGLAMDNNWHYLGTGYGVWFLIELFGFVALPAFVYMLAVREKRITLIKWTAAWTVLGIVVNRFNVSLVAFNWQLPSAERYFPSIAEIGVTVFLITIFLLVFRFMVTRMPVLHEHPEYKESH